MRLYVLLAVLSNISFLVAENTRYKGVKGVAAEGNLWVGHTSTLIKCTKRCEVEADCGQFSYNSKNGVCRLDPDGASGISGADASIVLYKVVTTTAAPRTPELFNGGEPVPECPVVYREWAQHAQNTKYGVWSVKMSTTADGGDATNIWDGDNTSTAKTNPSTFPWLQLDFGKPLRVTQVEITAANQSLASLDIRIGASDYSNHNGEQRITGNTRCNVYNGPTRVYNEVVVITCNSQKGLMGPYLTIQQTERFENNALEIAELKVEGFGRVCDTQTTF